jgi:putative Holliday junction resolvase
MEQDDGGEGVGAARRTLALDYGDRRIGMALSDPGGIAAGPLMTLGRTTRERDMRQILEIVRVHEVGRIVVGLPLEMDGTRGARARITETFMNRLRGAIRIPVIPWDERLTTVQAERALLEGDVSRARRRQVIDQVAAVIILQAFLDAERGAA